MPKEGKGKVVYVTGKRNLLKPLRDIVGQYLDESENARYYKTKKQEGDLVFEATISENKFNPRVIIATGCSNDSSFLERNLDRLMEEIGMFESANIKLSEEDRKSILKDLEKGYDDFVRELAKRS